MWTIKSKIHNTFYQKTINRDIKHFVADIKEAKKMGKYQARLLLKAFKHQDNFELKEVK